MAGAEVDGVSEARLVDASVGTVSATSENHVPFNRWPEVAIDIRRAEAHEADQVSAILVEAAEWLEQRGIPLWRVDDLGTKQIAGAVEQGLYVLARVDGEPAGTFRFQLSDPDFWPELNRDDSVFVHRLAVRRRFAGTGVSKAMLAWCVDQARTLRRRYLRLDCDAARPKLCAFYENYGFAYHSEMRRKSFQVARYELCVHYDVVEEIDGT
jgi:GNAT superfamily N-acetyltransferase